MITTTRLRALLLAAAAACAAPAARADATLYFAWGELGTVSRTDINAFLNVQTAGGEDFETLPMPHDTSVPSFTQNGATYEAMTASPLVVHSAGSGGQFSPVLMPTTSSVLTGNGYDDMRITLPQGMSGFWMDIYANGRGPLNMFFYNGATALGGLTFATTPAIYTFAFVNLAGPVTHFEFHDTFGEVINSGIDNLEWVQTSAVPEPATWALWGIGLAAFGAWRRRRGMPALLLGATVLGLAAPAQAVVMTATSTSASSQPTTVPVTQTLQNGDFLIGANPSAGAGHVTGDGIDETTTWSFDFSTDPQYAAFIATGGVAEARLTLELNTQFFVNGVGPITDVSFPSDGVVGIFPGWQIPSFINGTFGTFTSGSITTSLVAQVGMSGSALFGWLHDHGGLFPMIYADDAIVTGAALTLVSAPVPEPAPAALLLAGIGVLAWRRLRPGVGASVAALGLLPALPAPANTLSFDAGTTYVVTPAMEDFATLGSDMAGMPMTVVQGGVSQTYTWGVLEDDYGGFTRGGVITDSFAIWATGDTWCAPGHLCASWMVSQLAGSQPITQVVFHGAPGGVVFDLATQPAENFGTPGSAQGFTFAVAQTQFYQLVVDAVYRNQVAVGAGPVVGDLYTTLELNFAGNGLYGYMQFGADTDRIPAGAVIHPAIPEPASAALLLAGIGVLSWRRLRLRV